ncbi:amino acid ABC transporter membrane protein 1, PAAT family [Georgenia satyanarayanai]|uniref:Amino acid ABC transporter membrane protein 1, PAAT family n=1 Tax=Georgenia satyanarayanai TaxID=860221 RepID=A0A2Y9ACY9_9MICO|nr:amino acid ABC transporter permease [Georgenia satyanarayanai]PYF99861.1 amino acid ABC transporter membrane protein 1 (PAAT family) [Georgenia satyanarayanai]SSA41846.1 amino acid ABC transporter membrane protein 1, PAAT family [Georgenia satyanarayanai]
MNVVLDNLPAFWDGFLTTLYIAVVSGVISLVAGVVLAAMRVSPLSTLRWVSTAWVEVMRNTPLTLLFIFVSSVLLTMDILIPIGRTQAIVALSVYTSAFVCEAVRSGINSVGIGQAEAARSIGLTGGQSLTLVVLPQALRTVVPPIINVLIAMVKNTSIAAGFASAELVSAARTVSLANPGTALWVFSGIAVFYLIITVPAGTLANRIERKVAFAR